MKLQKLGFEIRKIGNVKSLYRDVDAVLSSAGITQGNVTSDIQRDTTAHALQKMISGQEYFSVCTVDKLAKISGIIIPKERQNIYNAAHCMDWSEMVPDYRQKLVAMVLDDFRSVLNPEAGEEVIPI